MRSHEAVKAAELEAVAALRDEGVTLVETLAPAVTSAGVARRLGLGYRRVRYLAVVLGSTHEGWGRKQTMCEACREEAACRAAVYALGPVLCGESPAGSVRGDEVECGGEGSKVVVGRDRADGADVGLGSCVKRGRLAVFRGFDG